MHRALAFALTAILLLASHAACAAVFDFATVSEGAAIVAARDDYVERLSPLERALKAKSTAPVSEREFTALLASAVRPWTAGDRAAVERALGSLAGALAELRLPLPARVPLVRATGAGEGGASHTRATAVVLTDQAFGDPARLPFLLAHELFHVASRHDRHWRDALYAAVGFHVIDELVLPPALASRRITNPDAPRLDVAIRVQVGGGSAWVAPVLQATVEGYDAARGADFFTTMQLVWLEIGRGDLPRSHAAAASDPPRLWRTQELGGFADQVGRNTGYVIHPDEILADNFAQIATGVAPRSPEVHERIRRALTASR